MPDTQIPAAVHRRVQARILALAFVAMFASAPGQSFMIAVFVDDFLAGTGLSRTLFSALYAAATVVSATGMMLLGRALDRFGLRPAWACVTLLLATACGLASVAGGILVAFLALALLRTSGQGSFPLLGTLLVARWFEQRRGRAMAVASFGLTAASTALPPAVVGAIVTWGWRTTYRLMGLVLLVLILPLAVLIHPWARRSTTQGPASTVDDARFPPATRPSRRRPGREFPTGPATRLLVILSAPPLVVTAVTFHAVSLLGTRGLSLHDAGLALSVLGLAGGAGTLLGGVVTDRWSTRSLLATMNGLLVVATPALLLPSRLLTFPVFVLLGVSIGMFGVVSGIVWVRSYGLVRIGRLQGMSFSVQIGAAALGPLPLAVSLAVTGSYDPALLALSAYALLTCGVVARWST